MSRTPSRARRVEGRGPGNRSNSAPRSLGPPLTTSTLGYVPATEVAPATGEQYVDARTIEALRAKADNGNFDLTKLLALIDELNDSYASENTYSCLALIRAIIDHVPPIFGCKTFAEVASSYTSPTWTRTDKDHAKSLRDSRALGDDALHRMISKNVDALSMGDVPAPARLRVLLRECAGGL